MLRVKSDDFLYPKPSSSLRRSWPGNNGGRLEQDGREEGEEVCINFVGYEVSCCVDAGLAG